MIGSFNYLNPVRQIFGEGASRDLAAQCGLLGIARPLLVTDNGLVSAGVVEPVLALLRQDLHPSVFADIEPNPTIATVEKGLGSYRAGDCDGIIAVGGGSVMDAAKAIGILATNGGAIADYEGVDRVRSALPPLIAVPTTCGTGSEVTRFAIITDPSVHKKRALASPHLFPRLAVLDPALLYNLPAPQLAATGMDALSHAVESYVSRISSPITDALNEAALALFHDNLLEGYAVRSSGAMSGLLMASTLAGMAIGNTRGGLVHAMSHPITAWAGTPHGVVNAIIMPSIMRYNASGAIGRYSRIAHLLRPDLWPNEASIDIALAAADMVDALRSALGIPALLSDVGVAPDMIEPIINETMAGPQLGTNPRTVTREAAHRILSDLVLPPE